MLNNFFRYHITSVHPLENVKPSFIEQQMKQYKISQMDLSYWWEVRYCNNFCFISCFSYLLPYSCKAFSSVCGCLLVLQSSWWAPVLRPKTRKNLFGPVYIFQFLFKICKNEFKNLIRTSKFKFSFRGLVSNAIIQCMPNSLDHYIFPVKKNIGIDLIKIHWNTFLVQGRKCSTLLIPYVNGCNISRIAKFYKLQDIL